VPASYGILQKCRWLLLSAKFHYRPLGVGYSGLQSAKIAIVLKQNANGFYSWKSEFADVQASQFIQARCSEITSLAQMHPCRNIPLKGMQITAGLTLGFLTWDKWSPPTTQYYVNILRLNYNMQYLVEEGEALWHQSTKLLYYLP